MHRVTWQRATLVAFVLTGVLLAVLALAHGALSRTYSGRTPWLGVRVCVTGVVFAAGSIAWKGLVPDSFAPVSNKRIAISIGGTLALLAGSLGLDALARVTGWNTFDGSAQVAAEVRRMDSSEFALASVIIALVPAVGEELFFRGSMLPYLFKRQPAWVAIVTSSVLFGAVHGCTKQGLLAGLLGLILGWVRIQAGLVASVLAHASNNFAFAWLARSVPNDLPLPIAFALSSLLGASGAWLLARSGSSVASHDGRI